VADALLTIGRRVEARVRRAHAVCAFAAGGLDVLLALAFSLSNRRRLHAMLFTQLALTEKARVAAVVAALSQGSGHTRRGCRSSAAQHSYEIGLERFRAISFDDLAASDFDHNKATRDLYALTVPVAIGAVDAFLTHSWRDDGAAKYAATRTWAFLLISTHLSSNLISSDRI
jgi:hypothetical protein